MAGRHPLIDGIEVEHARRGVGRREAARKQLGQLRFEFALGQMKARRLPGMAAAFANLAAETAVIDTELISVHADGRADFYALMREMRTSKPDESALVFMAFDLLLERDVDLRGLPLSVRLRDLERLLRKSRVPCVKLVESFPVLLQHCEQMKVEGTVSKRLDRPYVSGESRGWQKTKCEGWRRQNEHRHKLFEKPPKPPAPTERERVLLKKREELARVQERLVARGLRAGMKAALEAQRRGLQQEIAELEGVENDS
jgi:hypothetical protein